MLPRAAALILLTPALLVAQSPLHGASSRPEGSKAPPSVTYLFPEQVSIPAGKPAPVDLHFKVAPGLHVNSHNPTEEALIPTTLSLPDDSEIKLAKADYPQGASFTFPNDPSQKLSVYTGEFSIHTELVAPKGNHLLQASLRYQACSNSICLPPRTIPVAIDIVAK